VFNESGNWDSTYTTVFHESANWDSTYTTVFNESANWDSTYNTVTSLSNTWDDQFDSTEIEAASANWNSTYTTVTNESADWESTYSTVGTYSADWESGGTGDFCGSVVTMDQLSSCGTGTISVSANLDVNDNTIDNVHSIQFHLDDTIVPVEGKLNWNETEGTLDLGLKGSAGNEIGVMLGMEQVLKVKSTEDVTRGEVVYISSAQGSHPLVTIASNDSQVASHAVAGIAAHDIDLNQFGYITTQGILSGIDTSGISAGDNVYLGVDGSLTNVVPTTPDHEVRLGYCIIGAAAPEGKMYVSIDLGYDIEDLHDVGITSIQDKDVLSYNSSTSVFENVTSDNWESTYTTVSSISAAWNSAATAFNYNVGNTNSIEIGALDGSIETGLNGITIQGARTNDSEVASGDQAIAIGHRTKASGDGSIAIGGAGSLATGEGATSIGYDTEATGPFATAIGTGCINNGTRGAAIGYICSIETNSLDSAAYGMRVRLGDDADNVTEIGNWNTPGAYDRVRASIRCGKVFDDGDITDAMVCVTTLSSETANAAGGADTGNERHDEIPRYMHTIRRWENDFFIDANDGEDNITTIPLGGGGTVINSVTTVTNNSYTQAVGNTHSIYNDDDVSVTSDITAALMPAAGHTGTSVHKKIGSSHNVVITPPVGATIDGQSSFTLQFENESISIFSDGTNFYIT
jgi:hypothetical protein